MNMLKKIQDLGLELPAAISDSSYLRVVQPVNDTILYVSGTGNIIEGKREIRGRIPVDVSVEDGLEAAKNSALNILAILQSYLGDLSRIKKIVKILVFVASEAGFSNQHIIANGASEIFINVLGEKCGKSARSAIGVASLPLNYTVEIEAIVEIEN